MEGTGQNHFSPQRETNRAMVVTILYRLAGKPGGTQAMEEEAYYADAVAWALESGILQGYEDGSVRPEETVTREQIAVLLYRYAAYLGLEPVSRGDLSSFEDGETVSTWAVYAMRWAVGEGLLQGSGGKLTPGGIATRAQTAAILTRFLERVLP